MQQRIREAFTAQGPVVFLGPVEVDECYLWSDMVGFLRGREGGSHPPFRIRGTDATNHRGVVQRITYRGCRSC